ncbi:ACP S-malonyltransferase [Candidatus Hepatincolaceae symbiont of Richtersius coronifer]
MRAFLFPGQGSQVVGMGLELYNNFTTAKEVFNEINDTLNFDLKKVTFEDPGNTLGLTENTQPAIMSVSMTIIAVLEKDFGFNLKNHVNFVAGHSLGEYSALAANKSFSLPVVAKLLRSRGKAMQACSPIGLGAMAAILGIDNLTKIEELIAKFKEPEEICVIANDNCLGQTVISGHSRSINKICDHAKEFGASRAVKLTVSGSFHSPLMQKAAETIAEELNYVKINAPQIPVISNVVASPIFDKEEIKALLVAQITQVVRWRDSMHTLIRLGVDEVVEVGEGNVLTNLMKRIDPTVKRVNIKTPADIENFVKSL